MKKHARLNAKKNLGLSLLEIMIVVAAGVIISLMVYGFYRVVFAAEKGLEESVAASQLTEAIVRSYDALPNFTTLSTSQVIDDNILPKGFTSNGNVIYGPNGSAISISSETIQGTAGRGFSLTYQNVNQKVCTDLATGVLPLQRFISITVGSTEVAPNGVVDESKVATACNAAPTSVKLVYERGGTGSIAALEQCALPSVNPETREKACSPGYTGKIIEKRTASCLGPYELPTWTDWTEDSNTCAIICVVDPASPQTRTTTECPTTHLGTITEQRVSTCPQYTGYPVWGDWTVKSNTCQPKCVAPPTKVDVNTKKCTDRAGYTGNYTTITTYNCAGPTGDYTTTVGQEQDNCKLTCKAQIPSSNVSWRADTKPCGAGFAGNITFEKAGTIQYTCQSDTSTEVPAQGPWTPNGQTRNENSSACVALCKPETVLEQWVSATGQCQVGYIGGKTFEKRQTRTSVCQAGASAPTTSAWSDTGQTRNMVDNCVKICTVPNPNTEAQYQTLNELQQFACPAGTYGPNPGIDEWRQNNQARTRTAYCPQPTGDYAWTAYGEWYTTGYTPWNRTANHCNGCPAAYRTTQYGTSDRNVGCPSGYTGQNIYRFSTARDYTVAYSCAGGSAAPAAYATDFEPNWREIDGGYSISNSCYCGTTTGTDSQQLGCPSGQFVCSYGRQTRSVTRDCQGNIISAGGWVTQYPAECRRANTVCR